MIPAVSILSNPGLIPIKNQAGPVYGGVGILEIVPRKKDIPDVREDLIPNSTKDFKDTVKRSFAEGWEGKFVKHFRSIDVVVRPF